MVSAAAAMEACYLPREQMVGGFPKFLVKPNVAENSVRSGRTTTAGARPRYSARATIPKFDYCRAIAMRIASSGETR